MKNKYTLEELRETIETHMELLKGILKENEIEAGFDKTDNNLVFFDKELYSNTGNFKGFKINLKELIW